jgi:hypothetical protein
LKQVRHLTIENIKNALDFTALECAAPISVDDKCFMRKLELINCISLKSLIGLGNIPILIVKSCSCLVSLEGLGNNRIIILENNRLASAQLDNYSRQFLKTGRANAAQYMLRRM